MIAPLTLAFLSGFIALSYEILWYRAFSFTSMGTADTFAHLLGAYLTGLAGGAVLARRVCRDASEAARPFQLSVLFRLTVIANVLGFFVVPMLAWMVSHGLPWRSSLPWVAVAAAGLGSVFPLVSHTWIAPDDQVGRRVSYIYLANIVGSTAGSLVTGFILMDHYSMQTLHQMLFYLGLAMAALLLKLNRGAYRGEGVAAVAILGLLAGLFARYPFDRVYEKLQYRAGFPGSFRFAHVVETKSGVITVDSQGHVFGGGIYDGAYNTSLVDDKNAIIRCYALADLHPAPREALMIGLSSGSWATVVANHPGLERLTVIEINPGYQQLIPKYSQVAGLLTNPKVRIEIDDGRRWLVRNPDRRFDLIVANATFHWRSNASNLLSKEFLELVRSRLNPGGIYYYNTTGSARVVKTGMSVFPHAVKILGFLAVSDAPIGLDPERLREKLFDYPRDGRPMFDRADPGDVATADRAIAGLRKMLSTREESLATIPPDLPIVTDDNMGTEWTERP